MIEYQKSFISMRYFLLGAKMYKAVEALEFAHKFHQGVRKDNVSPEFSHQIAISQYMRTLLNHLTYPEETLTSVYLHDTAEDADVGHLEIASRFGSIVSTAVKLLTKKHRGIKKPIDAYYQDMTTDEISSIVKGADRIHNVQSMSGAFSAEKQISYIRETTEFVHPMLKQARRNFPQQEPAYENVKFVLKSQIALIQATLNTKFTK
jgi:(p)ppGpp synthase/HD superfamily hydrolase